MNEKDNTLNTLNTFNILEARQISFSYSGEEGRRVRVFDGLSLSVQRGELVAVLGHNGSGKSTLAKHFNAILLPEGGVCYVEGMDTRDEDKLFDIRQRVGMVFQNPDNQIVATIVEEDVAFAPENLGIPPAEIRTRVDRALGAVNMLEYKSHAPHQLSGGQKQRVAIAGVIAMQPDCIVLDEPTAMLDPRGRSDVMQIIHELNTEHGITVVLITHNMDEAVQCGRVVVMDGGRIILDDTPQNVFTQVDKLVGVGLGVPQGVELIHMLRAQGYELPQGALTEAECTQALADWLKQN